MNETCTHLDEIHADIAPSSMEGCSECLRSGAAGYTAHVHDLWRDWLLRQLPEPAREQARRGNDASDHQVTRARRRLALLLPDELVFRLG